MPPAPGSPAICLNMIVKNEAKVIARCLESVKPLVDAWAIVDTGSTDGTQAIIRSIMADLPGELYERPWKNFGHNRSEAIALARGQTKAGDYLFVIDADDLLASVPRFTLPKLTKDAYQLRVEDAGTSYLRIHLFRADLDYRYVGVLHEVLTSAETRTMGRIDGLVYKRTGGGARSVNPNKYRNDAAVLAAALEAEPGNARYAFYLAQSWRDCGEHEKSMAAYAHRAAMGGWVEEVYFSLHEVARMMARLGKDDGAVIDAYLRAYEYRPTRAEPLCNLAAHLREHGRRNAAYPFARTASEIPRPEDILFVDDAVYAWRAIDEHAVAAYWAGRYKEAMSANQRLLASGALPQSERERVQKNMAFCRDKLGPAKGRLAGMSRASVWPYGAAAASVRGSRLALLAWGRAPLAGSGFERREFPGPACTGEPAVSVVREPFVRATDHGDGRCLQWSAQMVAWTKMRARVEMTSEPGGVVSIDGRQVVFDEGAHPARTRTGAIDLDRGVHSFVVRSAGVAGAGAYLRVAMTDELAPHNFEFAPPLDGDAFFTSPEAASRALEARVVPFAAAKTASSDRPAWPAYVGCLAFVGGVVSAWLALRRRRRAVPWLEVALGALLFFAAFLVRARGLAAEDDTWDELIYVDAAGHWVRNLALGDFHPEAWRFSLTHPPDMKWALAFGVALDGEAGARIVATTEGALAVALVFAFGCITFGRAVGAVAGALAVFLPLWVAYGRIAGHESHTLLWWTASMLGLACWLRSLGPPEDETPPERGRSARRVRVRLRRDDRAVVEGDGDLALPPARDRAPRPLAPGAPARRASAAPRGGRGWLDRDGPHRLRLAVPSPAPLRPGDAARLFDRPRKAQGRHRGLPREAHDPGLALLRVRVRGRDAGAHPRGGDRGPRARARLCLAKALGDPLPAVARVSLRTEPQRGARRGGEVRGAGVAGAAPLRRRRPRRPREPRCRGPRARVCARAARVGPCGAARGAGGAPDRVRVARARGDRALPARPTSTSSSAARRGSRRSVRSRSRGGGRGTWPRCAPSTRRRRRGRGSSSRCGRSTPSRACATI